MNICKNVAFILTLTFLSCVSFADKTQDLIKVTTDKNKIEMSDKYLGFLRQAEKISSKKAADIFAKKLIQDHSNEALYLLASIPRYMPIETIKATWFTQNIAPKVKFMESYLEYQDDERSFSIDKETLVASIQFLESQSDDNTYVAELLTSTIANMKKHLELGHYKKTNPRTDLPTGKDLELVIVGAEWCHGCHELKKDLVKNKVATEFPVEINSNKISIPMYQLDYDIDTQFLEEVAYPISTLPAIILLKNGTPYALNGYLTFLSIQEALANKIQSLAQGNPYKNSLRDSLERRRNKDFQAILIGTGKGVAEVPLFTYESLKVARQILVDAFKVQIKSMITLFGSSALSDDKDYTKETPGKDGKMTSSYEKGNEVYSDEVFNYGNLSSILTNTNVRNNLLVFSGHGSPEGVAAWNSDKFFTPRDMKTLHKNSGSKNIIVSGTCYGGAFALSSSCGFFAARPDLPASGCWTSMPSEVKDYTNLFFKGIQKSDSSKITFEEAHFGTFADKYVNDTPFTSLDALTEGYFKRNKTLLQSQMSFTDIKQLLAYASPAEQKAFQVLFKDYTEDDVLYIKPLKMALQITEPQKFQVIVYLRPINGEKYVTVMPSDVERFLNTVTIYWNEDQTKDEPRSIIDLRFDETSKKLIVSASYIKNGKLTNKRGYLFVKFDEYSSKMLAQSPSHLQLVKRLMFKKAMATNPEVSKSYKSKYDEIVSCESQNIQDFIRGE